MHPLIAKTLAACAVVTPSQSDLPCRRNVLLGVTALTTLPALPAVAAPTSTLSSNAANDASARAAAVDNILSRIPVYLITSKTGEPYLTEVDEDGKRGGFVFVGPNDAVPMLEEVRKFDTSASLAVVPLSTVYLEVAKNSADAAAARRSVPQPRVSTSRDVRLFQLRPLSDEQGNLNAISMLPGATMQPGVVLYYEPSLYLGADEASRVRPYFFRLADLNRVWRTGGGDDRNYGRVSPSLRIVTLESLLRQVASGSADVPPMIMPPGETAELSYKAPE